MFGVGLVMIISFDLPMFSCELSMVSVMVYALLCVLSCDWCAWSLDATEITRIGNPKFENSFQID